MKLTKANEAILNAAIEAGSSYTAIRTTLLTIGAVEAKDVDKLLESRGLVKGKKLSITDRMYSYLEDAPRTQKEFYAWILAEGTDNTWRWRKAHDKVRELSNRLHISLSGVSFNDVAYEEPKTEEPAEDKDAA